MRSGIFLCLMISRKELIRKDEEKFRPVRKILPSGKLTLVRQLITSKVLRNYLGHLPYGGFGIKDEEKFRPVRKILPSGKLTLVRQLITSKVLRNYLGHLPYGGFGNGFQHFQVFGHHGDWGIYKIFFGKVKFLRVCIGGHNCSWN